MKVLKCITRHGYIGTVKSEGEHDLRMLDSKQIVIPIHHSTYFIITMGRMRPYSKQIYSKMKEGDPKETP